jgi:membrane-bound ClpP family serine protease
MDPVYWAGLLIIVGIATAVIELFVPSGGLLGLISLASLVVAIGLAFKQGPLTGLSFLAIAVIGVPSALALALRWWPSTPMGRRLLLDIPDSEKMLPDTIARRELKALVGKVGEARSLMMPSGAIEIDGHMFDALSEGMPIEAGSRVKVVEVRGTRVVVRPTTEEPVRQSGDPLSQPIESIGIDPFENPAS